jgi:hypothetical protein
LVLSLYFFFYNFKVDAMDLEEAPLLHEWTFDLINGSVALWVDDDEHVLPSDRDELSFVSVITLANDVHSNESNVSLLLIGQRNCLSALA